MGVPQLPYLTQSLNAANVTYRHSVSAGTKRKYGTGERRWFAVAKLIGTDNTMRLIPPVWTNRIDSFKNSSMSWPEACMVTFLQSTVGPPHPVAPDSACNYLSAVRKYLENEGVDIKFFHNSQYIRNTKMGMAQLYRVIHNAHPRDSERLSVTIDMIIGYYIHLTINECSIVDETVYTAQLFGFTTISRVSEYLETPDKEHLLITDRVMFENAQGERIPAFMIRAEHVTTIVAVTIDIRSKKNDQKRRGFKFHFALAAPGETYCIVTVLLRYVIRARPIRGRSFFYIPATEWTLRPPFFNKKIKDMARFYKMDEARFSSHSLRIGGATTLSAAGLSYEEVKRLGGWESDAILLYLRRSILLFDKARRAMSSPTAMTVNDTRRLYAHDILQNNECTQNATKSDASVKESSWRRGKN